MGAQVEDGDMDYQSLKEGYVCNFSTFLDTDSDWIMRLKSIDCALFQITVTPLGALSHAETDCQVYFKEWLPSIAEHLSSSAL